MTTLFKTWSNLENIDRLVALCYSSTFELDVLFLKLDLRAIDSSWQIMIDSDGHGYSSPCSFEHLRASMLLLYA
jgi:hypothetical protein